MPVKKSNILLIIFVVGGFLMTVYFGCNYAICQQYFEFSGLDLITEAIERTFSFKHWPWDIFALNNVLGAFQAIGLCVLIYSFAVAWIFFEQQRKAHFKKGLECGSTHWNDDIKEYNKTYTDPIGSKKNDGPYNMILTNEVSLYMNSFATQLNNNVTVVGGSGSGKSRFYVKPNLLQANTNYVVTDPSGELLKSVGSFLQSQGYTIKVFNLVEMAKSHCYNPFDYIRDDLGVVMMIKCLIRNTTSPNQKGGDQFWEKSEEALLQALCFYLIEARPKKDRNFTTIMRLLRCAEVNEYDANAQSSLDKIFIAHEKENPNSLAVKQYKTFKMGAGKTLKSILISCSVRLTVFNLEQIAALTRSDDEVGVELEKMGEGKRALFVIIPSADSTYNFLVSMMYSQLFETLYHIAETQKENKRLDSPVRFLLDEFANIGEIPEFTKKLATVRKYDISCSIILQNLAQIKTMYKDDWQTILGNCDSFLFLGGQEYETVEYISKELGNATITVRDSSQSFGKNTNSGKSYKQTKRELMTPDELMRLKNKECILLIRGLYPFRTLKYKYTKHPNYKATGDAKKELEYKLGNINIVCKSRTEIIAEREREQAKRAKNNNLIGDAKPFEESLKTAGIKTSEDITIVNGASSSFDEWTPINIYETPQNPLQQVTETRLDANLAPQASSYFQEAIKDEELSTAVCDSATEKTTEIMIENMIDSTPETSEVSITNSISGNKNEITLEAETKDNFKVKESEKDKDNKSTSKPEDKASKKKAGEDENANINKSHANIKYVSEYVDEWELF